MTLVVQKVSSLPALVKAAATKLASASTAAEVLDAKAAASFAYDAAKAAARFAKAKGAFDDVITAVYRAQADALEIEAMAKRRLADEYDAAQRDKAVAGHGGKRGNQYAKVRSGDLATTKDIKIPKQEIYEARIIRDAEKESPGIIRKALDQYLATGQEPTKAALGRDLSPRLAAFSGDNEWYTPAKYIDMARAVMGKIDLDPASNTHAQKTIKATNFYTKENSGLKKKWSGRVWMNPPYSNPEIQEFSEKIISEIKSGNVSEAIVLTNNSGDTAWHHALAKLSNARCVTRGRIKFESLTRDSNSPAMGQIFFYFGENSAAFAKEFSSVGRIEENYKNKISVIKSIAA